MPGELYQIYANKAAIDEKRTAIKGSGFSENYGYWSSREYSSGSECIVLLNNGFINYYGKNTNAASVLGFLALEV